METAILVLLALLLLAAILLAALARRKTAGNAEEIARALARMESNLARLDSLVREEFGRNREESRRDFMENREELSRSFKLLGETLAKSVADLSNAQKNQLDSFSRQIKSFEEAFSRNVKEFNDLQRQKFDDLAARQERANKEAGERSREIREVVEEKLTRIQEDTNRKLEKMRETVDEKLQASVERRFTESFRLINERLESVHKGLGEMQTLAAGVGDLKKVLTNVKTRGTYGEVQLGAILEQVLSPEQYTRNEHPGDDRRVVEYSIKLPGQGDEPLLLPVDSKFPIESYQRLVDAYENNTDVEQLGRQFENSVKGCARDRASVDCRRRLQERELAKWIE